MKRREDVAARRGDGPLFVPLRTEWFRAFERGDKDEEFRLYGPGWNERTCPPGRAVVLSHGYSGAGRLAAVIVRHRLVKAADVPGAGAIYPRDAVLIGIKLAGIRVLRAPGKAAAA